MDFMGPWAREMVSESQERGHQVKAGLFPQRESEGCAAGARQASQLGRVLTVLTVTDKGGVS